MTYVRLNNKDYELPLAELYIKDLNSYVRGNVLNFDGLDVETKYKVVDYLFGYLCRTFIMTLGDIQDTDPDYKYSPAIKDVRARMDSVDRMQKFCRETGKTEKAIELMSKFMVEMLTIKANVKEDFEQKQTEETAIGGR